MMQPHGLGDIEVAMTMTDTTYYFPCGEGRNGDYITRLID